MSNGLQFRLANAALVAALALATASEAADVSMGAFRNADALGTTLERGKSTKADVRKALGVPNGSGNALFPALGVDGREIWYYEDIAITGTKHVNDRYESTMRQQIMLVFFKGEVIDGYFWTSNGDKVSGK
jgi:outer membrane protein assembly factor BamE (lipoprotein component of BamABCDE complex)